MTFSGGPAGPFDDDLDSDTLFNDFDSSCNWFTPDWVTATSVGATVNSAPVHSAPAV